MTAADTGDAYAHGGSTVVTGHHGPAPQADGPAATGTVRISETGDAYASQGGIAITGYVGTLTVTQHGVRREPTAWPHQTGVIPPRAQSFQRRTEARMLRAPDGHTEVPCLVLTGTGGVGKTQLAADYARASWRSGEVDVLVWITVSSRSAVVAGYAQAGIAVLGADPADPEQAAKAFLAWLESKPGAKPCRWLVVLDDLADPADLRGLWPPASSSGRTLVTTRRRDAALTGENRRLVRVGPFTPDQAAAHLGATLASHGRREPLGELVGLAGDLGYLPLALSQAAAYLVDSGLDCASYRRLLADRATRLRDVVPEPGVLPDDQSTTVAAAWSLSVERADRLRPVALARPVLQLAAMLDPNGIPHAVLTCPAVLARLSAHRGGRREPAMVTSKDALGALRALHRLSLIDHSPSDLHQAVRVHQLIQRATRDAMAERERQAVVRTAADALADVWPDIERDSRLAQVLRSNTDALRRHGEGVLWRPAPHPVLLQAVRSLGESGQTAAAAARCLDLAQSAQRRLGPAHPDSQALRGELARWRGMAGDAPGAATLLAELLADRLRLLGPDHLGTLTTRHELAWWRGTAGDVSGAVVAFEQLLVDRLRVQGPDDPGTLTTRHSLARWRGESGDAAGAAAALAEVAADRERVLGPDHPATIAARGNHTYWHGMAGDPGGAAAAFEQLVADHTRVLGPHHPGTLATRRELARWRGEAGDAAGAVAALGELLDEMMPLLGARNPETLITRHELARWRGEAGDAAGAVAALGELLEEMVAVVGPDDPDTLRTRRELVRWRAMTGDAA
ncbi:tetratricopeptide repeat protein [Streptomyces hawaiiensis]|uniref:tetratricopeptide repeat protein n=1 Tax=Streptomyces hawaiiensis TaxID=67305 RepID=UPI0036559E00